MRRTRTLSCAVVAGIVALAPTAAHAHLVSSGMGPFYDGVTHLFLSPDDFLGVIALSLFAGLSGKPRGRAVLFTLPAVWIAGGLLGLFHGAESVAPAASALSVLAVGILLATNVTVGPSVFLAVTATFGAFHGYLNGTTAAASTGFTGLLGIAVVIFIMTALLSSIAVSLRAYWMRIAVRVAGSWIAAFGLLMTGWALR